MARRFKRIQRRTLGKDPIKKSNTLVDNIGQGSNVSDFTILKSATDRSTSGTNQTIRDSQDTSQTVNIGDIVKYVNLFIQAANRDANVESADSGWLEWAVVYQQEGNVATSSASLGTRTLGDVCTKTYRGNCLMSGVIPVGAIQPVTQNIIIKIPKKFVKVQQSSLLQLKVFFRSVNSTDVRTDNIRICNSALYKLYV